MADEETPPRIWRTVDEILAAKRFPLVDIADIKLEETKKRGDRPIEHCTAEVKNRGEPLHRILWRGRQWAVTVYGVEALDGTYFFDRSRIADGVVSKFDAHHSWPVHMAEKTWVDIDDFVTCWLVAITLHGVKVNSKHVTAALSEMMDLTPDGE